MGVLRQVCSPRFLPSHTYNFHFLGVNSRFLTGVKMVAASISEFLDSSDATAGCAQNKKSKGCRDTSTLVSPKARWDIHQCHPSAFILFPMADPCRYARGLVVTLPPQGSRRAPMPRHTMRTDHQRHPEAAVGASERPPSADNIGAGTHQPPGVNDVCRHPKSVPSLPPHCPPDTRAGCS